MKSDFMRGGRGLTALALLMVGMACAPSGTGSIGTSSGTKDEPGTTAPGRAGAADEQAAEAGRDGEAAGPTDK